MYFDSTQATNYVIILGNDGLQSKGCFPTESIVQLAPNSLTDYIVIPLNTNIQPLSAVGVDFTACIPAISPLPVTAIEKLTEMCKIFTGVSSAITNLVLSAYQTQPTGAINTTVGASYYASMNGNFNDGYTRAQAEANIPACTIKGIVFSVITNTALTTTTFDLMINNVAVATKTVATLVTGDQTFGSLSIAVATGDKVALRITTVTSVATEITVSPITTTYISN